MYKNKKWKVLQFPFPERAAVPLTRCLLESRSANLPSQTTHGTPVPNRDVEEKERREERQGRQQRWGGG